jgi:hypothetical protein
MKDDPKSVICWSVVWPSTFDPNGHSVMSTAFRTPAKTVHWLRQHENNTLAGLAL